jgi:aspartate racemase
MGHLQHLADGGAAFAVIPAITPQIVAPQLAARSPLPLVDPIDGIVDAIAARGLRRVALFGTRFVIERRLFDRLGAVAIVQPAPDVIDQIHDAYVALVQAGTGSDAIRAHLRTIAHALCRDGAEAIVLAGTELSLVFDAGTIDFPAIDATALHLDAILARALG